MIPSSSRTSWSKKKFPVHDDESLFKTAYAASAYIEGFLDPLTSSAPITFLTAAVSNEVLGHRQFDAIPNLPSSSANQCHTVFCSWVS